MDLSKHWKKSLLHQNKQISLRPNTPLLTSPWFHCSVLDRLLHYPNPSRHHHLSNPNLAYGSQPLYYGNITQASIAVTNTASTRTIRATNHFICHITRVYSILSWPTSLFCCYGNIIVKTYIYLEFVYLWNFYVFLLLHVSNH